jgi:hypothetical protein
VLNEREIMELMRKGCSEEAVLFLDLSKVTEVAYFVREQGNKGNPYPNSFRNY